MTISADKVRELAARGERSTLDFKEMDYDWMSKASNTELAKDLMAMANMLRVGDAPAYILIGIKNDGSVIGVQPNSHLDDAKLHQKVRSLLNRTPQFVYTPVDVDGCSVGVYEIRPGGRPYFPLKDASPSLQRHVARYRDGTTTEVASPSMIIEWHLDDDRVAHRVRTLELQKLEAEAKVNGHMSVVARNDGPERVEITIAIENTGRSGLFIDSITWRAEWLVGPGSKPWPSDYVPPHGDIENPRRDILPPTGKMAFPFTWTRDAALQHFRQSNLHIQEFTTQWFAYHFEVQCHTELGGADLLRYVVK